MGAGWVSTDSVDYLQRSGSWRGELAIDDVEQRVGRDSPGILRLL